MLRNSKHLIKRITFIISHPNKGCLKVLRNFAFKLKKNLFFYFQWKILMNVLKIKNNLCFVQTCCRKGKQIIFLFFGDTWINLKYFLVVCNYFFYIKS